MKDTAVKGFMGVFAGLIGYLASCLNEMLIILMIFIIMDYIVGMIATIIQGSKFQFKIALFGALKKALYSIPIAVGYLGDRLILSGASDIGIILPTKAMLGFVVVLYLIGTEGFSITKNLMLIGVPFPEILLKFFGLIRDQAGKIIKLPQEGGTDEN
jgi:toxin secretion/phage lysis holin